MRAISAADAISPAIQRTRDFLFRPFNWGTFLKLSLVALITEGLGSNLGSSSHGSTPTAHTPMASPQFNFGPLQVAAIAAAVIGVMLLAIWIFYLVTRLRFAFFNCLVTNTRQIRPGWAFYRVQARRFVWLNLVLGFFFMLMAGLVAIPFAAGFIQVFRENAKGHFNLGLLLSFALPLIPIVLLFILAAVVADLILRDFMLPHYALDDATAGQAWASVWERISAEKVQFFVYLLLRTILPTIATIVVFFVLLIPGIVLAASVALVEIGLHSAFTDAAGGASIAGVILQVFVGVVAFGFALLLSLCFGGPLSTGTREFALVFYGSRYPMLGNLLYPTAPIAAQAP